MSHRVAARRAAAPDILRSLAQVTQALTHDYYALLATERAVHTVKFMAPPSVPAGVYAFALLLLLLLRP
jgi:hypothetical protein